MSLNEERTISTKPSHTAGIRDLHRPANSPHEPLNSTCPACLGTFHNMLFLNPCLHSLCFSCTQELLETEAHCPCCKQRFSSVFHPVQAKRHPPNPLPPFPSTTLSTEDPPPCTKQHPRKGCISFLSRKHKEKHASSPPSKHARERQTLSSSKSHSEDCHSLPCKDYNPPTPNPKRLHCLSRVSEPVGTACSQNSSSLTSPSEDNPPVDKVTKQQACNECRYCSCFRKKSNLDKASPGSNQDKSATDFTRVSPDSGDDAPGNLSNTKTSANLCGPTIIEGIIMLFSSSVLLFICLYTYLSLILSHK